MTGVGKKERAQAGVGRIATDVVNVNHNYTTLTAHALTTIDPFVPTHVYHNDLLETLGQLLEVKPGGSLHSEPSWQHTLT